MGRRSRKRAGGEGAVAGPRSAGGSSRAERDAARRQRAQAAARSRGGSASRRGGERPEAPWGSFPLSELVIFAGIVLAVAGFVVREQRGIAMILAGFGLVCLASAEVATREHLAGYRSHSTLLAGFVAAVVVSAFVLIAGPFGLTIGIALALGVAVFAVMLRYLRQVFRKRSGGLSFR
jgi:hypothetical protein